MDAMGNFFDLSTVAKRFRFVAVVEAISWGLLIIGMVLKRIPDPIEWPVTVFGMTHGIAFIVYLLVTLLAARELSWNWKVTVAALVSSIPPFATVVFEIWAARNGHLAELSTDGSTDSAGAVRAAS